MRSAVCGFVFFLGFFALANANKCWSITPADMQKIAPVVVERIKVHGRSLEANLERNSADRDVIVYLPPGYSKQPKRRFPVVYMLHGYGLTSDGFAGLLQSPGTLERAFAAGVPEMILVLPDTQTRQNGSMYSSSITIGNWENFIADDLVDYIDSHYRTLAKRESRGLGGHSMGGYGTIRIGMKRPDRFGALYIMSPCCLSARAAPSAELLTTLHQLKNLNEVSQLDFLGRATLTIAAAWSPNPNRPPFYLDLPQADGADPQQAVARWAANAPLIMLDQYSEGLRSYRAIAMDVGDQDGLRVDASALAKRLNELGISASFQIYSGDHASAVVDRLQNYVLPFFAKNLVQSDKN